MMIFETIESLKLIAISINYLKDQIMTNTTSTPKNFHILSIDTNTQALSLTWTRNPTEIERILNNLHLFNITPTKKLINQIESITLQKTSIAVTDIFSI
jgi:acetolactate synthase small subunit